METFKNILKKAGPVALVLLSTLLAYKFYMWNQWKVERAVVMVKKIVEAPAAVNMTLWKGETLLYRKSFAYNTEGNYYLINRFDIGPYIDKTGERSIDLELERGKGKYVGLYRFEKYNIVVQDINGERFFFVFTNGKCRVEDFSHLRLGMAGIVKALKKNQ